jgi:hypothetical protein
MDFKVEKVINKNMPTIQSSVYHYYIDKQCEKF